MHSVSYRLLFIAFSIKEDTVGFWTRKLWGKALFPPLFWGNFTVNSVETFLKFIAGKVWVLVIMHHACSIKECLFVIWWFCFICSGCSILFSLSLSLFYIFKKLALGMTIWFEQLEWLKRRKSVPRFFFIHKIQTRDVVEGESSFLYIGFTQKRSSLYIRTNN